MCRRMRNELTSRGMTGAGITRDEAIVAITRKLVEVCAPVCIYLFGSVARGDDGPDSDLDFLVVVPDDAPQALFRSGVIARALWGIPYAADAIPWRQSDLMGERRLSWRPCPRL